LEYFQAQNHCKLLAPRVRGHLDQLALQANTVDVVAHSMGNRLIFEALSSFGRRKVTPINHMFSLAAAVDDEALDRGEIYSSCLKRCREVSILFSRNDGVLKGLYPLAEFDSALGTAGSEDVSKLPSNSKQVDCTSLIDSHSAYLTALPVFYFIRNTLLGKIPSPQTTQTLELLSDGSVKILQKPSMPDLTTIVKAGAVAVAFVFGIWGIYRKAYGI